MHDYMKIFFKNITIQGNPLVWKLDEKTNQATCLMYCVKTDHSRVEPHITPEMFKDFPDIIFEDGKFIIKDVRNFNSPYQSIEHLEEIRKKIAQPGSAMLRQQSSFFKIEKIKPMRALLPLQIEMWVVDAVYPAPAFPFTPASFWMN